jgi:hypothetical protein
MRWLAAWMLFLAGRLGEPARRGRHVGHGAVMFAVRPRGNRIAAEVKIRAPRVAIWPAAGVWGERENLFSGGGGRRRRRRLGRLRFGAAVCSSGDRSGGQLKPG